MAGKENEDKVGIGDSGFGKTERRQRSAVGGRLSAASKN
jgi:hypothetical protein